MESLISLNDKERGSKQERILTFNAFFVDFLRVNYNIVVCYL